MHRLRTVTYLDVSAVAGHHAMPAALLFGGGKLILQQNFRKLAELHSAVGSMSDSRARGSRVRYPVRPDTFISPSTGSRRAVVSSDESKCGKYWLTA